MPQLSTDLEALTSELLALRRDGVGRIPRVVMFGSGLLRDDMPPWSRDDIAAIARNFQALSTGPTPPMPVAIGLDHVDGGPAVGRVTKLWQEPGGVLVAEFDDLPKLFAEAIRQGLWFRVSAEIEDAPPFGLPGDGMTLTGVTLLGAKRPQIKWTSHLQDLVKFAEAARRPLRPRRFVSRRRGRGFSVWSESVMDRATLLQQLVDAGVPQAFVDKLDAIAKDDTELVELVNVWLAAKAGAMPAEASEPTRAQEGMTRDEMIARILELDPAQDRATLEALDDAALKELLIQLGGPDAFAELPEVLPVPTPPAPPSTVTPTPPNPTPTPTPPTPTTPNPAAPSTPAPADVRAEFAETRRLLAQLRSERAAAAREAVARRKVEFSEREARDRVEITAFAGRLRDEGKVSPSEHDGDPAHGLPSLVDLILGQDNSRQVIAFSENGRTVKLTRREAYKRSLDARPKRKFQERIEVSRDGASPKKAFYDQIIAETKARYAAANAQPAVSLRERLGMVPRRG
jgi:hypothetical protein